MPRVTATLLALGVLALLALMVRYSAAGSSSGLFAGLVQGADGRPSTSKFQWLLWSIVAIFAFVQVLAERTLRGSRLSDSISLDTPRNLLIAMGLSAATMALAKSITASYGSAGLIDKPKAGPPGAGCGGLLTDDEGEPDLSKAQMVSFTFLAIAVYLVRLLGQPDSKPVMVDVDGNLMALTGLSQGGYLGKKLATRRARARERPL